MNIPTLTTDQMRTVDHLMIETYHISLLQMMENAGRNLAELSRRRLGGRVAGKKVLVLSGVGNNGGGGMTAARHLHNWGADVRVLLAADPSRLKDVPGRQWEILQSMGIALEESNCESYESFEEPADLVLDALLGYGITKAPRLPVADWIRWANTQPAPVLALDAPSGLDTTLGAIHDPTIHAAATMTLALPKTGLLQAGSEEFTGEIYLADIGVPPELYARSPLNLQVENLFSEEAILRLL
jgi:NAD(P)H-hydrate epimerase